MLGDALGDASNCGPECVAPGGRLVSGLCFFSGSSISSSVNALLSCVLLGETVVSVLLASTCSSRGLLTCTFFGESCTSSLLVAGVVGAALPITAGVLVVLVLLVLERRLLMPLHLRSPSSLLHWPQPPRSAVGTFELVPCGE